VNVGEVRVGECVGVPAPDSESGSVSMVDDACRINNSAAGGGPEVGGRVRRLRRVVAACQYRQVLRSESGTRRHARARVYNQIRPAGLRCASRCYHGSSAGCGCGGRAGSTSNSLLETSKRRTTIALANCFTSWAKGSTGSAGSVAENSRVRGKTGPMSRLGWACHLSRHDNFRAGAASSGSESTTDCDDLARLDSGLLPRARCLARPDDGPQGALLHSARRCIAADRQTNSFIENSIEAGMQLHSAPRRTSRLAAGSAGHHPAGRRWRDELPDPLLLRSAGLRPGRR
jgi:hypothetical protein